MVEKESLPAHDSEEVQQALPKAPETVAVDVPQIKEAVAAAPVAVPPPSVVAKPAAEAPNDVQPPTIVVTQPPEEKDQVNNVEKSDAVKGDTNSKIGGGDSDVIAAKVVQVAPEVAHEPAAAPTNGVIPNGQ